MQVETAMHGQVRELANTFEVDKAIAALAYLSEGTSESMYSLLKMMYLADKLHLERYGRFIAGDQYCAMEQGPVPSRSYAIFQHLRGEREDTDLARAARYFDYQPENQHAVVLKERPDFDELSASELKCLDAIIATYRNVGKWAVRDLSHDAAWNGAWNTPRRLFKKSVSLSSQQIAAQFESPSSLKAHLKDPHPGKAELPAGFRPAKPAP